MEKLETKPRMQNTLYTFKAILAQYTDIHSSIMNSNAHGLNCNAAVLTQLKPSTFPRNV